MKKTIVIPLILTCIVIFSKISLSQECSVFPKIGHSSRIMAMSFSPDGKRLITGEFAGLILLWDTESGNLIGEINEEKYSGVREAGFTRNGEIIYSRDGYDTIHLYNSTTGEKIKSIESVGERYNAITISPDGKTLALATRNNDILIYDVEGDSLINRYIGRKHEMYSDDIFAMKYTNDGKSLFIASRCNIMRIKNEEVAVLHNSDETTSSMVFSFDVNSSGTLLVFSQNDSTIQLMDCSSRQTETIYAHEDNNLIVETSFSNNKWIAWEKDERIYIYGVMKKKIEKIINLPRNYYSIVKLEFSPDDQYLALGLYGGKIALCDIKTGKIIFEMKDRGTRYIHQISDDAYEFGFYQDTEKFYRWNRRNLESYIDVVEDKFSMYRFFRSFPAYNGYYISPNYSKLVTGIQVNSYQFIKFFKSKRHMTKNRVSEKYQTNPGFKEFEVLANSNMARKIETKIWSMNTGQIICKLDEALNTNFYGSSLGNSVFHPNSKKLYSAHKDNNIIEWSAKTGKLLSTFVGHEGQVAVVDVSSDGKLLLSGSFDRTIKIWDIKTKEVIKTFDGFAYDVTEAYFAPEDTEIVSLHDDNVVRIWNLDTVKLKYCLALLPDDEWFIYTPINDKILSSPNGYKYAMNRKNSSLLPESVEKVVNYEILTK